MRSWNGTGVRFRCRGMTRGSPESKNQRRGSERERERERVRGGRGEKKLGILALTIVAQENAWC